MESPRTLVRGVCPSCRRLAPLNADGRVAPHPSALLSWLDCGGAGYLPRAASPELAAEEAAADAAVEAPATVERYRGRGVPGASADE